MRRWRLFRRFIDYTVDRCSQTLSALDEEGLTDVIKLIKNPNAWSSNNATMDDNIDFDNNTKAQQLLDKFGMSPSQKDISASIFQRRLQIVWGPPVS